MTEILTESFCERCGTRYTFESARPKTRLKGVKVLSRGFKNFVMSDDTSMDEAMAAARNETDREQTAHQLDAFHKTFNFCMSCRQYTCPNCWNEVEARCLSCAPHLGHEVLPAAFPDLPSGPLVSDPAAFGDQFPSTNGFPASTNAFPATNGANGAAKGAELVGFAEVQAKRDEEIDAAARLAALTAPPTPAPVVEPEPVGVEPASLVAAEPEPFIEPVVEPEVAPEAPAATAATAAPVVEPPAAPLAPDVPLAPAAPLPADTPNPYDDVDPSTPTWLKALVVGSAAEDDDSAVERPAAAAAGPVASGPVVEPERRTPEPEPAVLEPEPPVVEPEPVRFEPEPIAETIPVVEVAAEPTPEPLPMEPEPLPMEPEPVPDVGIAAAAATAAMVDEPEPLVLEPEPEPLVVQYPPAVEPAPEPVAPPAPVVEPIARPAELPPVQPAAPTPDLAAAATATPAAPDDVVRQPTWQIVAPDDAAAPVVSGPAGPVARPEPQWPDQPQWPERTAAGGLPFLNRPATPTGGLDALWAESTRDVVSPSKNGKPANVVQPCINCGLSLSANARFCRRCGTPQGS
jgi:hypothetical protein